MEKLRKWAGLVCGVLWFLFSTIGGAAIMDFALREHTRLVAPFLPMLIIGWIGMCFFLRWMISCLLRFLFAVKTRVPVEKDQAGVDIAIPDDTVWTYRESLHVAWAASTSIPIVRVPVFPDMQPVGSDSGLLPRDSHSYC